MLKSQKENLLRHSCQLKAVCQPERGKSSQSLLSLFDDQKHGRPPELGYSRQGRPEQITVCLGSCFGVPGEAVPKRKQTLSARISCQLFGCLQVRAKLSRASHDGSWQPSRVMTKRMPECCKIPRGMRANLRYQESMPVPWSRLMAW